MISPEQSYPTGPVPPHTYGFPSWVTAYKIAAATTPLLRIKSCLQPHPLHRESH